MVVDIRPGSAGVSASAVLHTVLMVLDPTRRIRDLDDDAQLRAMLLVFGLSIMGYGRCRVLSGRRSLIEEEMLYGLGRTAAECRRAGVPTSHARPGHDRVVWCRPSDSDHVRGLALDVDFSVYSGVDGVLIGPVCRVLDIEWGGFWKVRDCGHFGFRRSYNGPGR